MKKKSLLSIIFCIKIVVLIGQTVICSENISPNKIHSEELIAIINKYKSDNRETFPLIYLVDFIKEDSLNKYRIYSDPEIDAPIFRQPDCIVKKDSITIVYLYTQDYKKPKDNLFLKILEQEMSEIFQQTIKYNWHNMTFEASPSPLTFYVPPVYDPPLIEYIFQNGILIEIKDIQDLKMYYEDTYIPTNYFLKYRVFDPRFIRGVHDRW